MVTRKLGAPGDHVNTCAAMIAQRIVSLCIEPREILRVAMFAVVASQANERLCAGGMQVRVEMETRRLTLVH
jgi:hypothetical protein